jgi:hypothetical protein
MGGYLPSLASLAGDHPPLNSPARLGRWGGGGREHGAGSRSHGSALASAGRGPISSAAHSRAEGAQEEQRCDRTVTALPQRGYAATPAPFGQEQRSNNIVAALLQAPGTAAAAGYSRQRRACSGLLPSNATQGGPAPAEAAVPRGNETAHREYLWDGQRATRERCASSQPLHSRTKLARCKIGASSGVLACSTGQDLSGGIAG